MIDTSKIIQAFCFILNEIPDKKADKTKLVKLLYLADKCHLIRYGRTITDDIYWAMPLGPVGSNTKDVLDFDEEEDKKFPNEESAYVAKMLRKINPFTFEPKEACTLDSVDQLSETDIEVLRFIAEQFGKWNSLILINYTHQYDEWKQYEQLFNSKHIKRGEIETEELLSLLPKDPLAMPADHIEESRRILNGSWS